MAEHKAVDEVLEFVWSERELGRSSVAGLLAIDEVRQSGAGAETIKEMTEHGLVAVDADEITLTETGEKLARAIIRRHRLAERLLTEVLSMDDEHLERNACNFEHTLTPEVAESICTLLGHPPTCPHGLPIPKGDCCVKAAGELKPLVMPLDKLAIGERGRIIFISSSSHGRLDKLSTLGIVPGSVVQVHQKKPAFVLKIDESTLALDAEIIKEIYVRIIR